MGKGVSKAVENINKVIGPAVVVSKHRTCAFGHQAHGCEPILTLRLTLQGLNPVNQKEVDQKMFDLDGTDNKGKLGANAILAVSMATCKVTLLSFADQMDCAHDLFPLMCMFSNT